MTGHLNVPHGPYCSSTYNTAGMGRHLHLCEIVFIPFRVVAEIICTVRQIEGLHVNHIESNINEQMEYVLE
jgi:hypothetical protein